MAPRFRAISASPFKRRRSQVIKSIDELVKEEEVVEFLRSYDVDPGRGEVLVTWVMMIAMVAPRGSYQGLVCIGGW